MIAEYDDMVGTYLDTLRETGLEDSTIVILGSDHGDMQMQHRQFYKMVAYEGSTRVPLVVAGPGVAHRGNVQVSLQQHQLCCELLACTATNQPIHPPIHPSIHPSTHPSINQFSIRSFLLSPFNQWRTHACSPAIHLLSGDRSVGRGVLT